MNANFYLIAIGISLIASLVFWGIKKKPQIKNQWVILAILALVFVMESAGEYTASRFINNSLLYNLGWVYIESILLIFYFYSLESSPIIKSRVRLFTVFIVILGLANTLFFQDIFYEFQYFTFLPFALIIIVLSIHFLKKILRLEIYSDKNILCVPNFWIACSIVFFYGEAILLFSTFQFYPATIIENVKVVFTFNRLLAGIMYLTFGLSFFLPLFINSKAQNLAE
ncbi:hypothetical protein MM236_11090 [Belliella sp. DSM 107340]|uniref:Histidine kinase N-terminal 7TM region domain-containing protein n=1 Tax=Belliella calami TaxID=2923436 RepID=A0ABS9UPJ0_9BACT|nr:hypothetical protein [Belliella calami]MCH7398540.1 hypothetical protein [Belliella calami]